MYKRVCIFVLTAVMLGMLFWLSMPPSLWTSTGSSVSYFKRIILKLQRLRDPLNSHGVYLFRNVCIESADSGIEWKLDADTGYKEIRKIVIYNSEVCQTCVTVSDSECRRIGPSIGGPCSSLEKINSVITASMQGICSLETALQRTMCDVNKNVSYC